MTAPQPGVVYVAAPKRKRWPYVLLGVVLVLVLIALVVVAAVGGFNLRRGGVVIPPSPTSSVAPIPSPNPVAPPPQ